MSEFGPDRPSDAYPLTDRPDVQAARRFDVHEEADLPLAELLEQAIDEIEGYDAASAEELGARRDLELWGHNPFQLEDG